MSEKQWFAIDVRATQENREAIEYGLMEAGGLGTETIDESSNVRVTGYFDKRINERLLREVLIEAARLYDCALDRNQIDLTIRTVANRDWLAEWKKSWQAVQVGRFIIAPPWLTTAESADPIIISIDPGMAFGTGTHETTRLCLKAIDRYYHGGSFLDVGTGTGVLAIAAAKCQKLDREQGPVSIRACDTDADAIEIAKENAELNAVGDLIDFQVGSVDETTPSADFVCANLTAPVIVELLPALIGATCGRLVLSGILDTQEKMVASRLAELGITEFEINGDGEWIAIVV